MEKQIHGFSIIKKTAVAEMDAEIVEAVHERSGARLIHVQRQDPNNLFCIGFRTPVYDDTGVAHILEHSVLSGSKNFPVRDPFQFLLKTSLQTFLNAMTYPDKTIYPVSSQVPKDYYNLMRVYCDAVFFPLLTEATFYQEGWHYSCQSQDKPIGISGIVYNEMKGVFSDFSSHVGRKVINSLFPDTTYAFESGGDPASIIDLTYEQFLNFHKTLYHPSNARFILYGDQDIETTLQLLHQEYLHSFTKQNIKSSIIAQPQWKQPQTVNLQAPGSKQDDGFCSSGMAWVLGESADALGWLQAKIATRYLIGTENSPLKRVLVDSGLGEDLDDFTGTDSDFIQSIFTVGLRRCKPDHARKIESLIIDTLKTQLESGFDEELLIGCVRRVEFSLREQIDAGRYPFGLQVADRILRVWNYDCDPLSHLKFEQPLGKIKAEPHRFLRDFLQQKLLNNTHRLTWTVTASVALAEKLKDLTAQQAREKTAGFTAEQKTEIISQTKKLQQLQNAPVSKEHAACVPKLHKSDVPSLQQPTPTEVVETDAYRGFLHPIFTSKITYLDFGFDCSDLPEHYQALLPLYSELITRCGAAGYSYRKMANRISLSTGGISSSLLFENKANTEEKPLQMVLFHGKALHEKTADLAALFTDILQAPQLDDTKLIKDILLEMKNDFQSGIVSSGHTYALSYAASSLNPLRKTTELLDGITQLRFIDYLIKNYSEKAIAEWMQHIHLFLTSQKQAFVSLTATDPVAELEKCKALLSVRSKQPAESLGQKKTHDFVFSPKSSVAIAVASSVNFVSKAWQLPKATNETYGYLQLLSQFYSRGYLWDKIRAEGGAYGAFASIGSAYPVFGCSSYRDPHIQKTMHHFDSGLLEITQKLTQKQIDDAVLGLIGQIDKPKSPHAKGYSESIALLRGRAFEDRMHSRKAILLATVEHIKQIAQSIITSDQTAECTIGNSGDFSQYAFKATEDLLDSKD